MRYILLFVMLFSNLAIAQTTPKTMTKVRVQLQSSDVPTDSFAAKPKVNYRAGNQYCRVEEEPDPGQNIHGLLIISEPDVWMVNLATQSARHFVDPGPSFNCRMPILAGIASKLPEEESRQIADLEFGYEIAFFKSRGAQPQPGGVLQDRQTTLYKLNVGQLTVALFTYGDPEVPLAVAWNRGNKHEIFWYSEYDVLDFDAKLFSKPVNVKIVEEK